MLLAVETVLSNCPPNVALHEIGMRNVLKQLAERLKPAFPKASVSVFLKDGGTILYTVDPEGKSHGHTARSYGEASQLVEDRLRAHPMSVAEMERTLGVDQAWPCK